MSEDDPPKAIVVTWTEKDWAEQWPHRLEKMLSDSPIKKAPWIASLIKDAIVAYEETGRVLEKPARFKRQEPRKKK